MPTTHPYDLVIGLDRSDRKADLNLIDTRTGNAQKQSVATSPEALHDWLARLRQDHPQERVAICLEQPAANLIVFLETYAWISLYPLNPSASRATLFACNSSAKNSNSCSRPLNSSTNRSPKFSNSTPTARSSKRYPGPVRSWPRGYWPAWARSASASPGPKICNASAGWLR